MGYGECLLVELKSMKVKSHRVSLILSLLAFVVATGFCALLLWEADAFEYSFLKVARHDMRLRTDAERTGGILTCDGLALDRAAQLVRNRGERISLTPGEYRLLEALMSHPGRIHTRAALLDMIQPEARDVTDRTVDVMLAHMRPKLGAWAAHIETARGIGYRLVP